MKLSEAIVKIMEKEGITDVFGIPGAGINGFYEALSKSNEINHYTMRHEECCVHAASGYFRATGKMAVATCTSGPGATNFITGMYTSNIDSIPLVAVTGQGVRAQMGKDAFQCVDMVEIAKPIVKEAFCLTDPTTAISEVAKAFQLAREGKPGVVLIDIPLDMQLLDVDFDPNQYTHSSVVNPAFSYSDIQLTVDLLLEASNPVIIMGGGVVLADACEELVQFAEMMDIPVITTYMAKGGIQKDHPLNAGHVGIQVGQPLGNAVFLEADVVLAIGNRFTDRHTGALSVYRGKRKFIHINISPNEIGKIFKPDLGIVADANEAILKLTEVAKDLKNSMVAGSKKDLHALRKKLARKTDHSGRPINPHRVYRELNKAFDENTIFTTGCGISQIWSGQLQEISKPRRYLPSGGSGTLGYDIPAAFGAMVGDRNKNKAVCVMGDFGFTFHAQEIATAARYQVPLIVCIVNNAYLGLIRQNQVFAFDYEYGVAMPENQGQIDFIKVAEGYGCKGERVFDPDKIAKAFERAKESDRPYIIDIICDPKAHCSMGPDLEHITEYNDK